MIKSIPLTKLVQSTRNVRRHGDPDADSELKARIAAHGLLQNLIGNAVKYRGEDPPWVHVSGTQRGDEEGGGEEPVEGVHHGGPRGCRPSTPPRIPPS